MTKMDKSKLFELFNSLDVEIWNRLRECYDQETTIAKMEKIRKILGAIYHALGLEEELAEFLGVPVERVQLACKKWYIEFFGDEGDERS